MMHKKRIIAGCMAGVLLLSAGGVFYRSKAAKKVEVEASQDVGTKGNNQKGNSGDRSARSRGYKRDYGSCRSENPGS